MILRFRIGVHPPVARPGEAANGRHQRLAGKLDLEFLGDDVAEAIAVEFLEHGAEGAFELDGARRMQARPRKLGEIGRPPWEIAQGRRNARPPHARKGRVRAGQPGACRSRGSCVPTFGRTEANRPCLEILSQTGRCRQSWPNWPDHSLSRHVKEHGIASSRRHVIVKRLALDLPPARLISRRPAHGG